MAKPMGMDALLVAPADDEDEELPEEEEAPERDPDELLAEMQSALDQLRAQLGSLGG